MANSTCSRGWSRRVITRASALRECGSTRAGDPSGVERLGIALEPEADYELRPNGGGGCEDPRVTFVEPLQRYLMAYAAFSAHGPRIALAMSKDLFHWSVWAWQVLVRLRALNSTAWMTRTPAFFRSPFPIHPDIRNWRSSTGRFSPARVRRKLLVILGYAA
jgi:hypothetical protein